MTPKQTEAIELWLLNRDYDSLESLIVALEIAPQGSIDYVDDYLGIYTYPIDVVTGRVLHEGEEPTPPEAEDEGEIIATVSVATAADFFKSLAK